MVEHNYAAPASTRNVGFREGRGRPRLGGERPARPPAFAPACPRTTVEVRSRLLGACGADGKATVDRLVRAIPDHRHPLSAVLSLVDAGLLEMDRDAPFGAATEFRRTVPNLV